MACILLIGIQLLWLGQILPRWIQGAAPAYPRQYEGRVLSAITGIGILVAMLVGERAFGKTPRGRIVCWACLGSAMLALLVDVMAQP